VAALIFVVILAVVVIAAVVAVVRLRGALAAERTRADGGWAAAEAGAEREASLEERATEAQTERDEAVAALEATSAELEVVVAERDRLQAAVDDTSGELSRLDDQLAELRSALANAQEAAREADAAAVAALAQADATEVVLDATRADAESLRAELEAARARPAPPPDAERPEAAPLLVEGLWALERARIERTWRQSVSLDPTGPGPFAADGDDDPVRVAIEVEAAAVREEVGSVIAVDWRVDGRLGAADGLLVVRTAQELLVSGSRVVEDGVLVVEREGNDVVVALRGPDGVVVDAEGLVLRVPVEG
jgi:hypothetical protein